MDKQYFIDLHVSSTNDDGVWHPLYKAQVYLGIERLLSPRIKRAWTVTDIVVHNEQVLVKLNQRPEELKPELYIPTNANEQQFSKEQKLVLIAQKIYEGLCANGLSQLEYAELIKVQPSAVSRWLSGKHNFTLETLFLIEESLNISLFDIYQKALDS